MNRRVRVSYRRELKRTTKRPNETKSKKRLHMGSESLQFKSSGQGCQLGINVRETPGFWLHLLAPPVFVFLPVFDPKKDHKLLKIFFHTLKKNLWKSFCRFMNLHSIERESFRPVNIQIKARNSSEACNMLIEIKCNDSNFIAPATDVICDEYK